MCDPIVSKSTYCEDLETIVTLPDIVCSHESKSLQEYLACKQLKHEECFMKLKEELESIHSDFDKEVEDLSELLRDEMKLLEEELETCLSGEKDGIEETTNCIKKVNRLDQRVKVIIQEFDLDLNDLGKKLCENIRRVLGQRKEEAVKINRLSFEIIEQIFEDHIGEVNCKILDKLRHCEDLKLKHQLFADEFSSNCKDIVDSKGKYLADIKACEQLKRENSDQLKRLVEKTVNDMNEKGTQVTNELRETIERLADEVSDLSKIMVISEFERNNEEYLKSMKNSLEIRFESINLCYLNLIDKLKSSIENFGEDFDNNKNELVSYIGDEMENEETKLIFSMLEGKKVCQLEPLEFWLTILEDWPKKLKDAKEFCFDVVSFWINNLTRLNEIRTDLNGRFGSAHQKIAKQDQGLNLKIKTLMKTLREAPDKSKLEMCSQKLEELFTNISCMWDEFLGSNAKAIEEIKNKDASTLLKRTITEADNLLQKYPKDMWFAGSDFGNFNRTFYNLQFLACINSINSVEDKTYSMRKDIANYVNLYGLEEGIIGEDYNNVFEEAMKINNDTYNTVSIELGGKTRQFEDIKLIRIAELEMHSERLSSHQAGVKAILKDLTEGYEDVHSIHKSKLQEFDDILPTFDTIQQLETRDQINSTMRKLEQGWDSQSIFLENLILDAKMKCQHNCETLKHSNDSFLRVAKNFKNGGNYTANELKTLTKELKQLEKLFLGQSKNLLNQYDVLLNGVSRKEVDSIIQHLNEKLSVVNLHDEIEEEISLTRIKLKSEISKSEALQKNLHSKISNVISLRTLDDSLLDETCLLVSSCLDDLSFEGLLECEETPSLGKSLNIKPTLEKGQKVTQNKSLQDSAVSKSLMQNITSDNLKEKKDFLSRVKLVLLNKYESLVNLIENKSRPISADQPKSPMKKELKQFNRNRAFEETVGVIKNVFLSYNKECELFWFQMGREFRNQLSTLERAIKEVSKTILDEAHSLHTDNLKNAQNYYNNKALEIRKVASELNKLRKSVVLPIAHPNYQHKLVDIYQQAISISESRMKKYKELVYNYQENLQVLHDYYVERVSFLKESLEPSYAKVSELVSNNRVRTTINEVKDFILSQPVDVGKRSSTSSSYNIRENETGCIKEHEKESTVEAEQLENLRYQMSIWDDEESIFLRGNDLTQCTEIQLSTTTKSILTMTTSSLKDSVEIIETLNNNVKDELKAFEREIQTCVRNLEHDMNQAMLIYSKICD